jgi:tetratricopeptide (TPR) repeat protein
MRTGQVFVSHTSDMDEFPEGRSFVQAALDAVSRAGMAPVDMRYFAARDGKPTDYCRQRVRECEIYVAVIGFRYGSMVPGGAVSYTELEFDEAGTAGLPRLVFLLDEPVGMPTTLAGADGGAAEGFRQRLRSAGLVVRAFTSPAALELEVFHALTEVSMPWAVQGTALPAPAETMVPSGPLPGGIAATRALPRDIASFTGREAEIESILATVRDVGAGGIVDICAIDGMAGIGKTALAVHTAHRLAGAFPDGQIFLPLHGHTPGHQPVHPSDALASLLQAAGIPAQSIPEGLEPRAWLWRDRVAGRRMLLLLDNAASCKQVAPLLPGDGECLVLITSRRHLGDLPGAVTPVHVDVLTPEQAAEMFTRLAPRAAASPAEVAEVVRLAGFLPLAISLLARLFAWHQSWTLADLAAETRASLLTLAAEHENVAAAFDVSYRHLDPARQRFFCLLGLHPGTSFDGYAAAALAGASLDEAARLLDALHREGLLTETSHRRYGMHDLLRRYARDHADGLPGSEHAVERLLDYYQLTAARADALIAIYTKPGPPPPAAPAGLPAPDLQDADQALAWARADRASLLACLDNATRVGQHTRVITLTAGISGLLRRDGPWADASTRHTVAAQAASHLGDRLAQANALIGLGAARWRMEDYPSSAQALEQALKTYCDIGNRLGQANALTHLGVVRRMMGDYLGAAQVLEPALEIYREIGNHIGQANALTELGVARWQAGDCAGAAQVLEPALEIYREIGNRLGQANALFYIGDVRRITGDYLGAAQALEQALDIFRAIGDRGGQANPLRRLGVVRMLTGDYLGAAQALEQALGIYRAIGSRSGHARVLIYIAGVRRMTGDYPGAAQALEQSLDIFRDIDNIGDQAEALNERGILYKVMGDTASAEECHRHALELARVTSRSREEADALVGLARCAMTNGHIAQAKVLLRQALEIHQRIGGAEARDLLAEVDTPTRR